MYPLPNRVTRIEEALPSLRSVNDLSSSRWRDGVIPDVGPNLTEPYCSERFASPRDARLSATGRAVQAPIDRSMRKFRVVELVRFEWDEDKNESNQRKHGISFETAALVFGDLNRLLFIERVEEDEERWHAIGSVKGVPVFNGRS